MPMAALPVNLAVLQIVQREPIVRWPGGFGGSRGGILPPPFGINNVEAAGAVRAALRRRRSARLKSFG